MQADDPNGDALTFSLIAAPDGMTINAESGLIEWTPAATDEGTHTIIVQVDDGRGGIADQFFYQYDPLYRLTAEFIVDPSLGNRSISYSYDAVENRLERIDSTDGITIYQYNANDHLINQSDASGTTNYLYDANGNVVSRTRPNGEQTRYTWDAKNRLIEVQTNEGGAQHTINYRYDADGALVAEVVDGQETRFQVDKSRRVSELVVEYTPAGVAVASYVSGLAPISRQSTGARQYLHGDGHSGTRLLTDAGGSIVVSHVYDSYGQVLAQSGVPVTRCSIVVSGATA